jgi:LPXTG-motif cell wall-anchored protein
VRRKLVSSILAAVMVFTTVISNVSTVFAAENTTNNTTSTASGATDNIREIALSPGRDSSELNITWYSVKNSGDAEIQIAKKADYDGQTFPADKAQTFKGTKNDGNDGLTSNKVVATGIVKSTEYVYRVGDGTNWSQAYQYTSQNSSSYNFILAGDPQIGASGNIDNDKAGWVSTVNKATAAFPNSSFLLSVGDQVNNGGEVKGISNETEYLAYFAPEQFKGLPIAAIAGNHETYGAGHNTHFNMPNESTYGTVSSAPTSGGDYYYTYGNTLFMMINSNDVNSADHEAFMRDAIAKNPNATWKVASLHHSIYSSADHATDDDIISRRNSLPQVFTNLGIDVVLDGHDHCYTRTYQMVGNQPTNQVNDKKVSITNPSGTTYQDETIIKPTGVAYITTNSASGSKYYEMKQANTQSYYEAVKQQLHVPTFSNVEVSDNSITITTYRTDNMEKTDRYTIAKSEIKDEPTSNITDITFAPGSDPSELNFTWYSDVNTRDTEVQIAKKSDYTNGVFPVAKAKTFVGKKAQGNNNAVSNKATVKGLALGTEYVYRVGNGVTWSDTYNFTTQNPTDYNFLLAGDPQIGASGDINKDKNGWIDTLNKATSAFKNSSFLLSLGDQVNNGKEATGGNNEPEYSAYFAPEQFRNLPIVAFAGNHETSGKGHNTHFNVPNESTYGAVASSPDTGSDYYFTYGNTLFMVLNSNDTNTADHKTFMQDAMAKNPTATWKVVALHHSIYSSANHETDADIIARRNTMPQVYTELGIDVVLDGHDHCYTRTYQMVNNEAKVQDKDDKKTIANPSGAAYQDEKVTDPTGVLYITANSASGSKYYEFKEPNSSNYYEAVKQQFHVPTFSNVAVNGNSIIITTYRTDNMEVTDKYTIEKTSTKVSQVVNGDTNKVVDALNNTSEGSNITVDVSGSKTVDKAIFDSIKGKDKTVNFAQDGLQWTFNGKDITSPTKNIDMNVNVANVNNSSSSNKVAIAAKVGNAGATVISFANNGQLPGKATVKVKLDTQWLLDPTNANKKLYVYYYNETTKKLENIASGLSASNGYVQFNITHNSDYIISDKDISEPVAMSISDARAKASGSVVLTGIVTNVVGSNVFMQDDNAAICLNNTPKADLKRGDKITVTGDLSNYHGLIEITPKDLASVAVVSSNNNVIPKVLTISQANDSVQSQLVRLKGVTLKDINTSAASTIEDSTGSVVIYKMPELKDFKVGDKIDVVASVMKYDTTLELSVSSASDITKAGQVEANDVIAKIDSLPATLTLTDAQKVTDVGNAYNALSDDEKKLVTNLAKLTSAENTIAKLQSDKTASDAVIAKINAIPASITLADAAKITDARSAYNALTDDQKKLVANWAKLTSAEDTIGKLQADKTASDTVIGKINAIPASITLADASKVTDARKAYDTLSDDQKKLVTNISALTSAEDKLKAMQSTAPNSGNNNNNTNTNTNTGSPNTNNSSTSTSGSSNQSISSIPKTGAIIGTGVLLVIGAALIGTGVMFIRRNKNSQIAE